MASRGRPRFLLSFPFLFTCAFGLTVTELRNTVFVPRTTLLQRQQPWSERNVDLCHLPLPFCDPLGLLTGSFMPGASREQGTLGQPGAGQAATPRSWWSSVEHKQFHRLYQHRTRHHTLMRTRSKTESRPLRNYDRTQAKPEQRPSRRAGEISHLSRPLGTKAVSSPVTV